MEANKKLFDHFPGFYACGSIAMMLHPQTLGVGQQLFELFTPFAAELSRDQNTIHHEALTHLENSIP